MTITPPPALAPLRPPAPRRGPARLRLGQWYALGGLLMATVIIVALVQAGLALRENATSRARLIDGVQPATLQALRMSGWIGAQETAVRAYAATGDARHAAAYRQAVGAEAQAAAAIDRLLAGVPGSGPVRTQAAAVHEAAAAWRRGFADPVVADVPRAGRRAVDPARDEVGRTLFAGFRAANLEQQRRLTALHARAAHALRTAADTLTASMGVAAAMVVLAAAVLAALIRRTVVTPMARLTDRVRHVAQGDFAHPLDVTGPAEITELADIIDSMRHRIVQEWRIASEARELIDEQALELRRSNAELEQFAYVASHDLQEPLRKVASFCQMIDRRYGDRLDDRGRQYIDFAVDGAKRMQLLINDLLGFSRVGRFGRTEEAVSLQDVLGRALDNLSQACEESGAKVTADPLPDLPGDRTLLTQLFQNLVGNAIKFRGEEPPRVHIGARRGGEDGTDGRWEFSCTDNGIGVEPRYADRIFLIFQRLHPQDEYTGTGIGLAMCKKIVEYHGGRIWLDTEPGSPGTTIRWTLPSAADTYPGDDDDERQATADRSAAGGGRPG